MLKSTKHIGLAVSIWLIHCFFFSMAFGCRYTVRDIGFTDLGSTTYRLYFYTQNDTPEDLALTFKRISYAALLDANVKAEIVNIDQHTDHQAIEHVRFWGIKSLPAIILVAPEGQSLVLPISFTDETFKKTVWSLLEGIVSSPIREEILEHLVKPYGVVLLIHGKDTAQNKNARGAVTGAINEITRIMSQMPKPFDEPPRLVVIPQRIFPQERILLWSIGINENEVDVPYMVVLYGRGRRIGPVFKGDGITERRIFNVLSLVGADCECGLDRSWMLGTMIPLRWGVKVRSEVAKRLGFDAESPMVKTEMSQILSMGLSTAQTKGFVEPFERYSEGIAELKSDSDVPRVPSLYLSKGSTNPLVCGWISGFWQKIHPGSTPEFQITCQCLSNGFINWVL